MQALRRDEVRRIDQEAVAAYGMSSLVLMENAGRACADVLCGLGCRGPVVIVCGRGNNAGDGFVIARHLDLRGIGVQVVLVSPPERLAGDAAANFGILVRSGVPALDLSSPFDGRRLAGVLEGAEWAVDALLGTGATGPPRAPLDQAIRVLNAAAVRRLAVDLPSGLDADTGVASEPTFRAHHTCTMVAPKRGFLHPAARQWLGEVHVVDIGAPRRLIEDVLREAERAPGAPPDRAD
jgi:NAD(P)H-hydrate epimerase